MTASSKVSPPPDPAARLPLRLELNGRLGEARWTARGGRSPATSPSSSRDLVDHFPGEYGQVYRAVFSRPDWDTAPHRVQVQRGPIKVGSFPGDDTHQIWLTMSNHRMIGLSVTAPEGSAAPTTSAN